MSRLLLSPKAKSDLGGIWDFSLERWGLEQTEKYVRELWSAKEEQSGDLTKSVDISDVRKGYRKIRVGSHVMLSATASTSCGYCTSKWISNGIFNGTPAAFVLRIEGFFVIQGMWEPHLF